jgi:uncharacterized protein
MDIHRVRLGVAVFIACETLTLALVVALTARAEGPSFPPLTGRVVDDAGILSPTTNGDLTGMLARLEQANGDQLMVVTLRSLQGHSIEDFGYQLGRYWGIGQKGRNNGVLLIVAPNEHKVRIEVGYGLEGELTDATSRIIIERDILPAFRRGDFNAGVLQGATSILKVLSGNSQSTESGLQWDTQSTAGFQDPMLWIGLALMGGWGLMFLTLYLIRTPYHHPSKNAYLLHRARRRSDLLGLPSSFYTGGFGGGGLGSGGSGGAGFSGGGGSFGGGGASGSW